MADSALRGILANTYGASTEDIHRLLFDQAAQVKVPTPDALSSAADVYGGSGAGGAAGATGALGGASGGAGGVSGGGSIGSPAITGLESQRSAARPIGGAPGAVPLPGALQDQSGINLSGNDDSGADGAGGSSVAPGMQGPGAGWNNQNAPGMLNPKLGTRVLPEAMSGLQASMSRY